MIIKFIGIQFFQLRMIIFYGGSIAFWQFAYTFCLFYLVIRTAYKGKQFEFLRKEMRPADVATIMEIRFDESFEN